MGQNPLSALMSLRAEMMPKDTSKLDEAKRVVSEWPQGQQALEGIDIDTDGFETNLMGKVGRTFGDWSSPLGRSFAVPSRNKIYMDPNDDRYPETLAHEAGHIQQYRNGAPLKNDDSADAILNQLFKLRDMRMNSQPDSVPHEAFPDWVAEAMQEGAEKNKGVIPPTWMDFGGGVPNRPIDYMKWKK